jgi:peroxidase
MQIKLILGFCIGLVAVLVNSQAIAQYRTYDGFGNNIANPFWGSAGMNFDRWGATTYSDGFSAPSGTNRPNPRDVSNALGAQTKPFSNSRGLSSFVWQWGQFLDHDMTLTPTHASETYSIPVNNPNDPLFPFIPMARSDYDHNTGTNSPRQQFNANTAFIDASMVYGSDSGRANALRTFSGGLLKTSAGNMLPKNTGLLANANEGVEADADLFLAGDVRANEQSGLIAMHTIFMREHNRLATNLAAQNPTWTDEQIFQHSRSIVGGIVQSITYNEYLPALMGSSAPDIHSMSYNPNTTAMIANEFATAAFRVGHTQVTEMLMRMAPNGEMAPGGHRSMADSFFAPSLFSDPNELDYILNGLAHQQQNETDLQVVDALRNMLFGPPGAGGMDLLSLNIQRGRDHGLATYNDMAASMGKPVAGDFADLTSDPEIQTALASLYDSVDDVDLWIGLLAEDGASDSELGWLMESILQQQFTNLVEGDRFFYLWDPNLSQDEIDMITNTTLADVIARNSNLTFLNGNLFYAAIPEPASALICLAAMGILLRRNRKS